MDISWQNIPAKSPVPKGKVSSLKDCSSFLCSNCFFVLFCFPPELCSSLQTMVIHESYFRPFLQDTRRTSIAFFDYNAVEPQGMSQGYCPDCYLYLKLLQETSPQGRPYRCPPLCSRSDS